MTAAEGKVLRTCLFPPSVVAFALKGCLISALVPYRSFFPSYYRFFVRALFIHRCIDRFPITCDAVSYQGLDPSFCADWQKGNQTYVAKAKIHPFYKLLQSSGVVVGNNQFEYSSNPPQSQSSLQILSRILYLMYLGRFELIQPTFILEVIQNYNFRIEFFDTHYTSK